MLHRAQHGVEDQHRENDDGALRLTGGQGDEGRDDEDTALKGIAALEAFFRSIGMPVNMRELGIEPTEEQILAMARSCAEANGGKKGSAKVLYPEDMAEIYRLAK